MSLSITFLTVLHGDYIPAGGTGLPEPTRAQVDGYRITFLRSETKRLLRQSGAYRVCIDEMRGHFALAADSIYLP